ncbi:MAG: aminoacyl-tRNA hydrolase [Candidatus Harrisonbacteria bacterium]|nr:aminoacyl-tRNA hydrolase [Candidatus Harrisonbacteria bacterium]
MKIKAIIALGNPGRRYEMTFHNVGILVTEYLEQLAREADMNIDFVYSKHFMNQSGLAITEFLKQKNFAIGQCLIVHDDSDLLLGEYKLSFDASSAGHRGIDNIIDLTGTQKFWRLRIGIRPVEEQHRSKASDFVLQAFNAAQADQFKLCGQKAFQHMQEQDMF